MIKLNIIKKILLVTLIFTSITPFAYAENSGKANTKPEIVSSSLLNKEQEAIPILMYHHITTDSSKWNAAIISPKKFRKDMIYLKGLGYNPINFKDYLAYIENGDVLPDNPIFITFDDGYYSNYEYAYPILKKLDMKATYFIIGWSVGRSTFIDNDKPIIPHFTWEQAKEMYDSGYIDIQSHSFDMHSPEGVSYGYKRKCALGLGKMQNEDSLSYRNRLFDDTKKMIHLIEEKVGSKAVAFAYPYGISTETSEKIMTELGIKFTITTNTGISNTSDFRNLKRINTPQYISTIDLMNSILKHQKQEFRIPVKSNAVNIITL